MMIVWSVLLIVLILVQETVSEKKHVKMLSHFLIFFLLVTLKFYLFATAVLICGIVIELSLFEYSILRLTKERVPNRFRLTVFLSLILATFISSTLFINQSSILNDISVDTSSDKILKFLAFFILGMFIVTKGRKWKR